MTHSIAADKPRAVQYVRMSTEHQSYSIESQKAAIAQYAEARGYDVIATYADEGKSGLTLKERTSLSRLLHDVQQPYRDFSVVLVLDITRWGRFQDPDESAAYEFFCREAGVCVEYAVEAFANDGSISTAIVKHLKRIMAGEYSRELSEKVAQAKNRQAQAGFRQGGAPNYCVRRLVIDAEGSERGFLSAGEQKFRQNDKIVFRPGTAEEVAVVQRIFHLFVNRGHSLCEIARQLNSEDVPAVTGKNWHGRTVQRVLRNELMIGVYVYNKTTMRLKSPRKLNPESDWTRVKVFDPIVSPKIFALAARRLNADLCNFIPESEMVAGLKRLLQEKRKLDWATVNACSYLPSASTIAGRFGGMRKAYELIGYLGRVRATNGRLKWKLSTEDLLQHLRRLYTIHGRLSTKLIISDTMMPSPSHYVRKFGSLLNAYALAGLPFTRRQLRSSGGKARWRRGRPKFPWTASSSAVNSYG